MPTPPRLETDEEVRQRDRREQRMMWMFSGGIVLLILGMMGANMLFHHPTPTADTDMSAQSRPATGE
jgi:hypothetical protein